MLQVTKGLTTKLTIPVDYINNVDGEKTRGAFAWDAGDEILVTLKHKKTILGYEATTSASGAIEFELSGDEDFNKYDVTIIFTRGGKSFNCYVGTLQIIDKATPDFNTLNGVYIYADDDTIKFIKAFDGERKANISELNAALEQAQQSGGGGGGAELCVKTTYAELKALRDNGKLIAGQSYRITDYTTITTQEDTAAAGHDFDVIVTAIDAHTLGEDARAALRAGDQYFKDCNLAAWRLRYALDMDAARFGWVITPESITFVYDGTTITLYRAPALDDEETGAFAWVDPDGDPLFTLSATPTQGDAIYAPGGEEMEFTVNSYTPPQTPANGKGVIYHMEDEHGNAAPYDFKNIMFGEGGARALTFAGMDNGAMFDATVENKGDFCEGNRIEPRYIDGVQSLGAVCIISVIGDCFPSKFNTVGVNCNSINITNGKHNVIGAECSEITLQNGCNYNTIGNNCADVTAGNKNEYIVMANGCNNISLGADNTRIYLGAGVSDATFDTSCKFANITVMAGVEHIELTCSDATSGICQNVLVNSGVRGTRTDKKTLSVPTTGNLFLTTFGKSSDAKKNV